MFTGIVSAIGRVEIVSRNGATGRGRGKGEREHGLALTIRAPYKGLKRGESIAVSGACLTVARVVKGGLDRKSTRLNSSHGYISYAVFCVKKKKRTNVPAKRVKT